MIGDIVVLTISGLAGLIIIGAMVNMLVEDCGDKLWPRGLRGLPGAWEWTTDMLRKAVLRIFWPEKRWEFKSRRVLYLESYDQQWRTWASLSNHQEHPEPPRWVAAPGHEERGRWEPYDERKHGQG